MHRDDLLEQIALLAPDWHGAGSLSRDVLAGIVAHGGHPLRSMETGAGKSTLLLSWLSDHHTVFSLDVGGSLTRVRESPLLQADSVTVVEGPSQLTLPRYDLGELDLAFIDGPHAYPFADLEYYHVYPALTTGGMLILDDTRIPSMSRMLDIIAADDMFDLVDMIDDTAFLRRTTAPTFDPLGDGWEHQGYNNGYHARLSRLDDLRNRLPTDVRGRVPRPVKKAVRRVVGRG